MQVGVSDATCLQSHTKVRDSSSGPCRSYPPRVGALSQSSVWSFTDYTFSQPSSLATWYGGRRPSATARGQKPIASTFPEPSSRPGTSKEVPQEAPSDHLCAACGAVRKIHVLWDCMQHDSLLHCEAGLQ